MNIIKRLFSDLYKAIKYKIMFAIYRKRADRLHEMTGKRYFVIPDSAGGMVVVCNTYIDTYNKTMKKFGKTKRIDITDLLKMSYYATSLNGIVRK